MSILTSSFAALGAFSPEANPSLHGSKLYTTGSVESLAVSCLPAGDSRAERRSWGKFLTYPSLVFRVSRLWTSRYSVYWERVSLSLRECFLVKLALGTTTETLSTRIQHGISNSTRTRLQQASPRSLLHRNFPLSPRLPQRERLQAQPGSGESFGRTVLIACRS